MLVRVFIKILSLLQNILPKPTLIPRHIIYMLKTTYFSKADQFSIETGYTK